MKPLWRIEPHDAVKGKVKVSAVFSTPTGSSAHSLPAMNEGDLRQLAAALDAYLEIPRKDIGAPLFKLGPWGIWHGGESPPDVPRGGMSTGSTFYWLRWPGGPWIQCDGHPWKYLKALSFMSPWGYDEPEGTCTDCGTEDVFEHADDCPRGRALRILDGIET